MNRDFRDLLAEFNVRHFEFLAVLSREHLIENKRAAGRTQELADVERLVGKGKGSS